MANIFFYFIFINLLKKLKQNRTPCVSEFQSERRVVCEMSQSFAEETSDFPTLQASVVHLQAD